MCKSSISRQEQQTTKVVMGGLRVNTFIFCRHDFEFLKFRIFEILNFTHDDVFQGL